MNIKKKILVKKSLRIVALCCAGAIVGLLLNRLLSTGQRTLENSLGFFDVDQCENVPLRQAKSPDKSVVATLFNRGCGATTSDSTILVLRPTKDPLDFNARWTDSYFREIDSDLVLFINDERNVKLKWLSNKSLLIELSITERGSLPLSVSKKESKWQDIDLIYQ